MDYVGFSLKHNPRIDNLVQLNPQHNQNSVSTMPWIGLPGMGVPGPPVFPVGYGPVLFAYQPEKCGFVGCFQEVPAWNFMHTITHAAHEHDTYLTEFDCLVKQESPADAGIPARRKTMKKNSSISKL